MEAAATGASRAGRHSTPRASIGDRDAAARWPYDVAGFRATTRASGAGSSHLSSELTTSRPRISPGSSPPRAGGQGRDASGGCRFDLVGGPQPTSLPARSASARLRTGACGGNRCRGSGPRDPPGAARSEVDLERRERQPSELAVVVANSSATSDTSASVTSRPRRASQSAWRPASSATSSARPRRGSRRSSCSATRGVRAGSFSRCLLFQRSRVGFDIERESTPAAVSNARRSGRSVAGARPRAVRALGPCRRGAERRRPAGRPSPRHPRRSAAVAALGAPAQSVTARSAACGGATATSLPSFATSRGRSPSSAQASRTAGATGTSASSMISLSPSRSRSRGRLRDPPRVGSRMHRSSTPSRSSSRTSAVSGRTSLKTCEPSSTPSRAMSTATP